MEKRSRILEQANVSGLLPIACIEIGNWWENQAEIDIVAIGEEETVIVIECKWGERTWGQEELYKLRTKIRDAQ